MGFSSQLRQFPQMIIALDKYTGYMFISSPNFMMSSYVAMEILCITNVGSISSKKIAGVEKMLLKCQIVMFFIENFKNIRNVLENILLKFKLVKTLTIK